MDALTLLREARAAGRRLSCEGDKLLVEGPASMAALRPPVALVDGCSSHGVTAEQVGRWWKLAELMGARVSVCLCCGGPSRDQALRCRRCEVYDRA